MGSTCTGIFAERGAGEQKVKVMSGIIFLLTLYTYDFIVAGIEIFPTSKHGIKHTSAVFKWDSILLLRRKHWPN